MVIMLNKDGFFYYMLTLSEIPMRKKVCIKGFVTDEEDTMRRRLEDLGFIHGNEVEAIQRSPLGDPTAYKIRGMVIALRMEDARKIQIEEFS